jgi:hypothetical protein
MDGNQDNIHVFHEQEYDGKCCTPSFNYNKSIEGSISSMAESCNLVNIHKLEHVNTPPTQSSGSTQIDFIFVSAAAIEIIERCDILDYNTVFSSDHRPFYTDNDMHHLLGFPVQGTLRALPHDLKLNDPRLIDAYQATLIPQLINHNVGLRVDALYAVDPSIWDTHYETRFNAADRDVERAMKCAANNCRRKYFKNYK